MFPIIMAGGSGTRFWPASRAHHPKQFLQITSDRSMLAETIARAETFAPLDRIGVVVGAVHAELTRQLVGEAWLHAPAFRYCGSVGPIRVECEKEIQALGEVLVARTGMRGLFGVDGVLREGWFWPVEVNPRYPASVEVLERATGLRALEWQCRPVSPRPADSPPRLGETRLHCKAILYARCDVVMRTAAIQENLADLPHPGERIEAGRPILTLFAEGADDAACLAALRARAAEVEASLYAD